MRETMFEPPSPDTIRRRQEAKRKQEERAPHEWGAFKRRVARDDQAKAQAREAEREMLARMTSSGR